MYGDLFRGVCLFVCFCIGVRWRLRLIYLSLALQLLQHHLIDKAVLPTLNCSLLFIKNQRDPHVGWFLDPTDVCVCSSAPHSLCLYSYMKACIRQTDNSDLFFYFQNCFTYSSSSAFLYNF